MAIRTIEQEETDFRAQFDEIAKQHRDEFVVFKDGKPVSFHPSYEAAYNAAVRTFGLGAVVLVTKVEEPDPKPLSLAWDAGVMFG